MKTKVLFLITKSNWGGAQRYVYDIATALDTEKYEPAVVLGGEGELKEKLKQSKIRTITIQSLDNTLSLKKLISITSDIGKVLSQERPNVLHCNSSIAGFAGVVAGRIKKIENIIFTAHGWAFNENRSFLQRTIFRFFHWLTVLLSHRTIAVSAEIKKQLGSFLIKRKWVVIHNGRHAIDFLSRDEARVALNLPVNRLLTGTIGELHPIKQHNVMIKAVASIRAQGHNIKHVIIGAGDAEAELLTQAEQLNISEYVLFLGAIDEAAQYLQAFDIYVQPSRSEALGYTVIEAAQAGLPIITSRVGGLPEIIIHNQNGLLTTSGDVEELSNAIIKFIKSPGLGASLGTAAKQTSERFAFTTMLSKTTALYDSNTTSSAKADSRATD